ncbi:HAMP domain-containing sensor histidine kinase [Motilimonas sp. 1_MG-2023]|uniref:sensor histidine kinase n=1 Tax=Motilimonas sp. 1_MG-2023 TaxID=3062672 RepID=UPI0026E39A7F|nr:HAMP domain-containing sensor histidine kinase [Motilimonas sp. 1_MG-2023]MDO6524740.1 HAMP domain-containing sensor histidine kinase [Motilimonas sp. 1_MG-2023]
MFIKLLLPTALAVSALSLLLVFWVPELTYNLQKQDQVNTLEHLNLFFQQQFDRVSLQDTYPFHPAFSHDNEESTATIKLLPIKPRHNEMEFAINKHFIRNPNSDYFEWTNTDEYKTHFMVSPIRLNQVKCVACHNQYQVGRNRAWREGDIAGFIAYATDREHIINQGSEVRTNITVIMLPFMILMLACALLNYRKTKTNVARLLDAAADITHGNLQRRVAIKGHDELALFGQAMNIMLDTLEQTQSELMASQQNLRKVSKELKLLNIELEQRIFERTDALNSALLNLKETQEELIKNQGAITASTLVAGIAHDINNPLGIALTAITYLRDENLKIQDKIQHNSIRRSEITTYIDHVNENSDIIENNLRQATQLIRSFKELSINQCNDALQPIQLQPFLESLFLSLSPELKKGQISYQLNVPSDLSLLSYPGFISQIFTNLVLNSIRHGYSKNQKGKIQLTVTQTGELLAFDYADDGCGINSEVTKKMFTPFFTTRKSKGGSGLGLNMVKELIKQKLKGDISVYNVRPHGLGFIITLPQLNEEQL